VALGSTRATSHLAQGLAAKGFIRIARTPGGRAEAVDLTPRGDTGSPADGKL